MWELELGSRMTQNLVLTNHSEFWPAEGRTVFCKTNTAHGYIETLFKKAMVQQ